MLEADSSESMTLSEISSEFGAGEGHLFLQTKLKDNGNEGYELVVLDGSSVWEGTISEYALDRQCEALKMDFNTYVKETTTALTKAAQSDTAFECIFKPQGQSSSNGQLVWKKVPAQNIKYNLGSLTMKKSARPGERTASVLSECIQTMQSLHSHILSLQADNERLAQERQNALKRLDKCVSAKDELEKDLYSKFVAVLNSKKERIRQMEENHEHQSEADQAEPVVADLKSTPAPSTSKTNSKKRVSGASSDSPGDDTNSTAFDIDTDEESPPPKKKPPRRSEPRQIASAESSLNLGDDDEEEGASKKPVARRARRQPTAKRDTPAKPILPRVPSISSSERDNQMDSRRSSLRKSGSGKSNKSSDNLDPDDLMNDF